MKRFNCPFCNQPQYKEQLIKHIDKEHDDELPINYTPYRAVYDVVNNKQGHGNCTECGRPTEWNEKRQKYNRLCGNPKCYEAVKKTYQTRMLKVYNKVHLLDDPNHLEKMLAHRKISGKYKWSDGREFIYTGEYEKKLMEFLDDVLDYKSNEIIAPGPVLEYDYKGKKHRWITDFLLLPYNLIIEVKDGGNNPNNRFMPDYRAKQIEKEKMITNLGTYSYIRLTDNDFGQLLGILAELKMKVVDDNANTPLYRIHENIFISFGLMNEATSLKDRNSIVKSEFNERVGDYKEFLTIKETEYTTDHPETEEQINVLYTITPKTNLVNKANIDKFQKDVNHLWMDLNDPKSDKNCSYKFRSFWIDKDKKTDGFCIGIM